MKRYFISYILYLAFDTQSDAKLRSEIGMRFGFFYFDSFASAGNWPVSTAPSMTRLILVIRGGQWSSFLCSTIIQMSVLKNIWVSLSGWAVERCGVLSWRCEAESWVINLSMLSPEWSTSQCWVEVINTCLWEISKWMRRPLHHGIFRHQWMPWPWVSSFIPHNFARIFQCEECTRPSKREGIMDEKYKS